MSRPKMIGSRASSGRRSRWGRKTGRARCPASRDLWQRDWGQPAKGQSNAGGRQPCPTVAGAGKFPAPLRNDPNGSFSIGESPKIRPALCPGNPRTGYRGFSEGAARNVGNRVRATLHRRARTFCQPSTGGLAAGVADQGTAYR